MILLLEILLWLSFLALLHSYFFYPLILRILATGKEPSTDVYEKSEDLPYVSVIMSVFNEEAVIAEKVESLLNLNYPAGKIHIFIGSDCSNDQTNAIVDAYAKDNPHLHFYPFTQRRGKPGVVNQLSTEAEALQPRTKDHIFLITDASVMLTPDALKHLTKHFKREGVVIVDAHMVHTGMKAEGISKAENEYISTEVHLKYWEGLIWGKMIGPFGGCYAIRSNHFTEVPSNFLVDDFYITMKVLEQGGQAINDLDAVCYESVSHEIQEEYRRKSRISAGNFQNMTTFRHLWWPPFKVLNFAFFSHKILRWLGPFFIIIMLLVSGILALMGLMEYKLIFLLFLLLIFVVPLLDAAFKKLNINFLPFRAIRYFFVMNLALLEGFFKFLKGIQQGVWEPPKRGV